MAYQMWKLGLIGKGPGTLEARLFDNTPPPFSFIPGLTRVAFLEKQSNKPALPEPISQAMKSAPFLAAPHFRAGTVAGEMLQEA
ncbi:hypothetical protein [Microvirga sp. TS319]|uniref:hypothetical protein n=1 Tax=Microvirga sp. TS319 TaxID=3241165 RepID=UPI00351A02AC